MPFIELAAAALLAQAAAAPPTVREGGPPIRVEAPEASWDVATGQAMLRGGVLLRRGTASLRAEQARWLREITQRPDLRDAPYRVVFCHIPLRWKDESPQDYAASGFDRHSGRSRAAWHDTLVAWKAQVILSGHTHRYL